MLKPCTEHIIPTPTRQPFPKQNLGIRKLVSVWNKGYPYNYKGKSMHSGKSSLHDFQQFKTALNKINETALKQHEPKIQWNVHGLKDQDNLIKDIEGEQKQIAALKDVEALDTLSWKGCLAFAVPDVHEDSFNFVALTAVWLDIPTIVSSESTVRKFLLSLPCQNKTRAVITMSSNAESYSAVWEDKIYSEVLNESAKPSEWANELTKCLHSNEDIWNLNLAILGEQKNTGPHSSGNTNSSHLTLANRTSTELCDERSSTEISSIYSSIGTSNEDGIDVSSLASFNPKPTLSRTLSFPGAHASVSGTFPVSLQGMQHFPVSLKGVQHSQIRRAVTKVSAMLKSTKIHDSMGLRHISDIVFMEESIWVCGWIEKFMDMRKTVFINLDNEDHRVQVKRKRRQESHFKCPIVTSSGENLKFALRGGTDILTFNTQSHNFRVAYSNKSHSIIALEYANGYLYILDQRDLGKILKFNSRFINIDTVSTGRDTPSGDKMDLSILSLAGSLAPLTGDHMIISQSAPYGSVRALNSSGGILWRVNGVTKPVLGPQFDPCSVSASNVGVIFVADRGTNKVHAISPEGKTVHVVLDKVDGILNPTHVRVDAGCERLAVINRGGEEIRMYDVQLYFTSDDDTSSNN